MGKFTLPFGRKKHQKCVGLDIGTFGLKVAVLMTDEKGNMRLSKVGKRPINRGAIVDKDIRDREGLIYSIQSLMEEVDPDITDVVIGLAGHKVLIDRIEVNAPSGKGKRDVMLREAIMVEAEQRIPTGIDSVKIDYAELGMTKDGKKCQVLLFAARNEIVDEYTGLVMDAGLVPIVIDLDPIAMYNIFELNHPIPSEGCIALVNIGHALVNVVFIVNGSIAGIRYISNAARSIWEKLQSEMRLSNDEMTELMLGKVPLGDSPSVRKSVYAACEELNIGLGMAFAYIENMTGGAKIDQAFICGGGLSVPFLLDYLSSSLGVSCDSLNPLAKISYDPAVFGELPIEVGKAIYSIAIGLAQRAGEVK